MQTLVPLGIVEGSVLSIKKKQRALRPQIDLQPRLILKLMHELGIHPRARRRQFPQRGCCLDREIAEHATGGPGRLAPRFAFFHHQHCLLYTSHCFRQSMNCCSGLFSTATRLSKPNFSICLRRWKASTGEYWGARIYLPRDTSPLGPRCGRPFRRVSPMTSDRGFQTPSSTRTSTRCGRDSRSSSVALTAALLKS